MLKDNTIITGFLGSKQVFQYSNVRGFVLKYGYSEMVSASRNSVKDDAAI